MSVVFPFDVDDNTVIEFSNVKDVTKKVPINAMQQVLNHFVGNKHCKVHNRPPAIAFVFPVKIESVNYAVGECCCPEFASEIRNIVPHVE
jgi:hypothetical protein